MNVREFLEAAVTAVLYDRSAKRERLSIVVPSPMNSRRHEEVVREIPA